MSQAYSTVPYNVHTIVIQWSAIVIRVNKKHKQFKSLDFMLIIGMFLLVLLNTNEVDVPLH